MSEDSSTTCRIDQCIFCFIGIKPINGIHITKDGSVKCIESEPTNIKAFPKIKRKQNGPSHSKS